VPPTYSGTTNISFNFPNENLDKENENSSDADTIQETPLTSKEIHDHISELKTKKACIMQGFYST